MLADAAQLVSLILRVRDRDAAADWYEQHLGVDVHRSSDGTHPVGSFELGGSVVSLWELRDSDEAPSGSIRDPYPVVVVTDGLDELRAGLQERGVDVDESVESASFRLFRFRDVDGNVWEVSQPR